MSCVDTIVVQVPAPVQVIVGNAGAPATAIVAPSQGPPGPPDHAYTDASIASLRAEFAANLAAAVDLLSPPSLDFSRPAMAGTCPPVHRI